jgi:RNA polymerase sigma factor (sigma-70 family)
MAFAERISYEPDIWADDRQNHIDAFNKLITRLSPTIKKITRKLSFRFSFVDDTDLYQEALLYLWTKLSAPDGEDKTDSYILQGCYFHMRNHIRTVQDGAPLINLSEPAGEDGISLEDILPWEGISAYDEVEGRLQIEAMIAQGMTDQELSVLLLSLEDLTTREIGDKLGVSHVRVVKIKNRIKDRYRDVVAYPHRKADMSSPVRDGIQV